MAVNVETIGENIFAILKGYGFTIRMFDDVGKKVIKPEDARRFFLTDSNLVITSSEEEIKVHLGKSVTFDEAKDTINTIKQLAKKYMMDFNIKKFGHTLQPKDYVFDLKKEADMNSIQESAFSKSYGSSKSSYQDVGNTRLVVRHAAPVNEESRGSRARNIKSIYIENAEGERFKFPSKNLLSARAMARHIANKGTPFDDGGKNIISLDEELGQLKNFVRYTRQNFKEENESVSGLHELAIMRVNNIKENLTKIKSSRTYNEAIQSINNDQIKNEEVEGELQEVLTKHTFDESLAGVLPYLATLVSEGTILERLELALLEGKIELGLFEDDDINNPSNFAFDSVTLKNQHWLKYIGEKATDEKVSALVTEIAEGFDVMEVADRNKALRLVKNNITFENQEKPDITDVIEESLDKQLSKYTSNDIFFEKGGIEGKIKPAWMRDAEEKGELRTDNETGGTWAGDTYVAGTDTPPPKIGAFKDAWKKINYPLNLNNTQLKKLEKLTEWRETLAQNTNVPKRWIMSDHFLIKLCQSKKNDYDLFSSSKINLEKSDKELFVRILNSNKVSGSKNEISKHDDIKSKQKEYQKLLTEISDKYNIPPTLIANKRDIEMFCRNCTSARFMQGWRFKIFGKLLQ